jgi:BirA family biotin operon repressor/biotin-[acetyl-CoA-carboxylase] ligase
MTRADIPSCVEVVEMADESVRADLTAAPELVRARGGSLGLPMHLLGVATSTNDEAQRGAKAGASHGTTWVAEQQTAGRGRRGRSWVSPAGEGLLFSLLLRLSCPPTRLPPLALLAGLAVREAVLRAAPAADVKVKWPNDVVVDGRKVAGVLVEAVTQGSRVEAVIMGIGINVHTRSFPGELADCATSVALADAGARPDRASLLVDVLASLERELDGVVVGGLGPLRARIDAADGLRGRPVGNDVGESGIASGIDEEGRLVVRLDRKGVGVSARWSAGEVHLIRGGPNPG